jgi:hypothetical protein
LKFFPICFPVFCLAVVDYDGIRALCCIAHQKAIGGDVLVEAAKPYIFSNAHDFTWMEEGGRSLNAGSIEQSFHRRVDDGLDGWMFVH